MAAAQQSHLKSMPTLKTEGDVVTNIMVPRNDDPLGTEWRPSAQSAKSEPEMA